MKKMLLVALSLGALSLTGTAMADHYVNGYMRSNGTYVQGHYQSDSNSVRYDNYSSQGNTNPYTGTAGTQRNEFSNPPAYNQGTRSNSSQWNKGYCYGAYCKKDD